MSTSILSILAAIQNRETAATRIEFPTHEITFHETNEVSKSPTMITTDSTIFA